MRHLKRTFLFTFLFLLTFLLVGCSKVDYQPLRNQIEIASKSLVNYTVTDQEGSSLYFDGTAYISKNISEKATKLLAEAKEALDKKASQDRVNELLEQLISLNRQINDNFFFGEKAKQYEFNLKGLEEAIKDINTYLGNYKVASNAGEVAKGTQFIKRSEYDHIKQQLKDIRQKITQTDPATPVDEKIINEVKKIRAKLSYGTLELTGQIIPDNFNLGDINDLLNRNGSKRLNLQGKTIKFYTHVIDEDDPNDPGFKSDVVSKDKYKEFIANIERDFNCKIVFEVRKGDYFEFANTLKLELDKNPDEASIIRVPELAALMDNIKAESIVPIDSLLNTLAKNSATEDYLFSDWQRERCNIFGKTFGIQRYDGLTYPDLMVFNRGLLKKLGFTNEEMPDYLWEKGEWNLTALNKYIKSFGNKNQDESIKAFGLTPKFLGINALTANGISLIDREQDTISQQLKINKKEVAGPLDAYKKIYDENSSNVEWYIKENKEAADAYNNDTRMLANHMRDTFNEGKLGMTMVQCWQVEMNSLDEYGIVPIPQIDKQENKKYISTIEAGDILAVTRGKNHHEVSLVLMLINKFFKDNTLNYLKSKQTELGVVGDLTNPLVFNELSIKHFVNKKIKYKNEEDKIRSEKVVAFMHGYKTKENNDVATLAPSHLAQIGADEIYSLALQKAFKYKSAFTPKIEEVISQIEKNYQELLNIVLRFN